MNEKLRRKNHEDSSRLFVRPGSCAPLDRGHSRKHDEKCRYRGCDTAGTGIAAGGDDSKKGQ
ncbi:MAG: hypothetical protein ABFD57_03665 [Smithella sp.]|nr:hypothetical protein [Syntrophaceae bacterium]NTW77773.1 hypothetical protein [Syntrophaceae bacterium]